MSQREDRAPELQASGRFQELPPAMREWILASPNAIQDFAGFFAKGGAIRASDDFGKPAYIASDPPRINVNAETWESLGRPETRYAQRAFFGTLAHEIGHDRYNTSIPFTGNTAEEYVQYRAGLEANAIFNAFPIFQDLKHHPDFKQSYPFTEIGYLNGLELGQLYKDWDAGKLTDKEVVDHIAARVPDRDYTLGGNVQDRNGDGRLTHRDLYLTDYERLVAPKQKPQAQAGDQETLMSQSLRDGVASLDRQANKSWDDNSERLYAGLLRLAKETGFRPDDELQVAFNAQTERYQAGELIHLARAGRGASPDPAQNRAFTATADLLATPAAENYEKAQRIPYAPQITDVSMEQRLVPDDPSRTGPVLRV